MVPDERARRVGRGAEEVLEEVDVDAGAEGLAGAIERALFSDDGDVLAEVRAGQVAGLRVGIGPRVTGRPRTLTRGTPAACGARSGSSRYPMPPPIRANSRDSEESRSQRVMGLPGR